MPAETWRVGRKLGRTLYVDDQVVGMVDTPELAARIVAAMNGKACCADPERTWRCPNCGRETERVAGVEVGTVVGLDLDAVRAGHVPWPGNADDGSCSCCGMPHPCVTRRLADALDAARAVRRALGELVAWLHSGTNTNHREIHEYVPVRGRARCGHVVGRGGEARGHQDLFCGLAHEHPVHRP